MRSRNHSALSLLPTSRDLFLAMLLVALSMAAMPAGASTCTGFSSVLTVPNSTTAIGTGPFGDVCVELNSSTSATITFTAATNYEFGDGSAAAVNVDATSYTPTFVSETGGSGNANFKEFDVSNANVDGHGTFNLILNNNNFGVAGPATEIVFDVSNDSGTWASAASVLTANGSGFDAVAHVRWALGPANANTGFAAEVVPEPASLMLLGMGVAGLATFGRKRIRS